MSKKTTKKMKPESEHLQGVCPCCNSSLWDSYGEEVLDGENLYFSYKCPKCGFEGRENYYLEFVNHN